MSRWAFLCFFLLLAPIVFAAEELDVNIYEEGKITSYFNTYWVVQVNGTGSILNPTDRDLFDVELFFDILTLEIVDLGGDGEFSNTKLEFDRLEAGKESTFSYLIAGITTEPPTLSDKGVLYTGFQKRTPKIFSDLFGELQKASLEDRALTGRDARLISVTLRNPSGFAFTVDSMKVIKTADRNPNNVLDEWIIVNSSSPRSIDPDGFLVHDILDKNAFEGEVYWLVDDLFISEVNLIDNNTVIRYTQENLTEPVEDLNLSNETRNDSGRETIDSKYFLRKELSDIVALPGSPLTVTIILYNLGETLETFSMKDTAPLGFTLSTNDLMWSGEVPARGSIVRQYDIVLNDTNIAGLDALPRAEATIGGETLYSREVPFIRQYVPEERIYVQKRIVLRDDDQAEITISIRNLGQNPLMGVTLKEFLNENALFSEITYQPKDKGIWDVPIISAGDEWELSYVTDQGASVTTLPVLYGVADQTVLRSIILENVVNEAWNFVRTRSIELFGIGAIILTPIVLLIGRRRGWFGR